MFKLEPEQAIEFMKSKGIQVTFDWKEIEAKARAKAFTIAKVTSVELLQDVRNLIVKAQKEGKTFENFKTDANEAIAKRGWSGKQTITMPDGTAKVVEITPGRLQTVYRTNMQSAYNAGRWKQIQDTKANRPYLQFVAIIDDSTSETCSLFNRKVFRVSDPIWDKIMPPLHHNCRSTVRSLSQRQLEREGLTVEDGKDYADSPEYAPAEGFENNPGKDDWVPDLSKYDEDLAAAAQDDLRDPFEPLNHDEAIARSEKKLAEPKKDIPDDFFPDLDLQAAQKEIRRKLYKAQENGAHMNNLDVLNEYNGYDAPFVKIKSEDFTKLDSNEYLICYRGTQEGKLGENYTQSYLDGEVFNGGIGRAVYGEGLYSAYGNEKETALEYSGTSGHLSRFAISKSSAKGISHRNLLDLHEKYIDILFNPTAYKSLSESEKRKVIIGARSESAAAVVNGYDYINVESSGYVVVLNRGCMIIDEKSYSPKDSNFFLKR